MSDNGNDDRPEGTITLAELAAHLQLTKGTVSAVLNNSPYARSIPQHTKDRIIAAAQQFNYRPNFFARTLRKKRTFTVGVIAEEIGDPYGSIIISGIEAALSERKYFFLTVIHRHDPALLQQYSEILRARGVEGIITVDTILKKTPILPTVAIAGHCELPGVTNIILDHAKAAELAISHLVELGHREIAFIKGQSFSSDSAERWRTVCLAAQNFGLVIRPELVTQLEEDDPSPEPGYRAARRLLAAGLPFTAIVAYNDISSIGAIRAIRETGVGVPGDVSIVGFDDIREAAYQVPSITTIRQPLRKMGALAARTIVERIEDHTDGPSQIAIEPELVIRESSGRPAVRLRREAALP